MNIEGAIKLLKQEPDFSLSYYKREKAIDILLEAYEKQRKEIEELKAITREYEAYECGEDNKIMIASKEWFNNGYFEEHYISKDKIKEKIKDLRQYEKEIEDEKDFEYYATLRIIRTLKLLLGGK